MPCSMSDFMSPNRASRSGARARGGLNDVSQRPKPGSKWRKGDSCSFNISDAAVRSGSRSCTSEVLVNVALMRKLLDQLDDTRQTSPPYRHSGMKAELLAFCELICGTKR